MDYNTIVTIVGSLGFPIAACIGLFWMINSTMKEFKETIAENTKVMTELAATVKSIYSRSGEDG